MLRQPIQFQIVASRNWNWLRSSSGNISFPFLSFFFILLLSLLGSFFHQNRIKFFFNSFVYLNNIIVRLFVLCGRIFIHPPKNYRFVLPFVTSYLYDIYKHFFFFSGSNIMQLFLTCHSKKFIFWQTREREWFSFHFCSCLHFQTEKKQQHSLL